MSSTNVTKTEGDIAVINTLRSYPVFTECSNCKQAHPTSTDKSFNFCNLLCCIFLPPVWSCCQALKVKDQNCYDATHSCTKCGKEIGKYSAC